MAMTILNTHKPVYEKLKDSENNILLVQLKYFINKSITYLLTKQYNFLNDDFCKKEQWIY